MTQVAIQGIVGSYSEEAAIKMLGASVNLLECGDFAAVFQALSAGTALRGIVPVRNKIVGDIAATAELLAANNIRIVDEFDLEIHHILAGTDDAKLADLRSIMSHPEALKQCSVYLAAHPKIKSVAAADTASSVQRISRDNLKQNAAIASARAARIYGAKILSENISNDPKNWTTFALIEK
ncbi:MAG: prephenate dehydratase domain-containing protein [Pyrinomonadaceae bacterium]